MTSHEIVNDLNIMVDIYRSSKREGLYVYLLKKNANELADPSTILPIELQGAFGKPQWVMTIPLSEQKKLARVNVKEVIKGIKEKGFFVQAPPDGLINPNLPAPEGLRGA